MASARHAYWPMISTEEKIQRTVVSLEAGALAVWIWRGVFVFVALGLSVFFLMNQFRGLPVSQAMDQAQIGREILRGHGWETQIIRPLAIGDLLRHGKDPKTAVWRDTYNAPVPPLLDAAAMWVPFINGWTFSGSNPVYPSDRAIACMGVIFFLASVVVLYFIGIELFDRRLATIACGLVLICDMMWRYSLSGLPQMALLLMLHLNVYALLRAVRARYVSLPHLGWVAAVGAGFGVMALTHALSIFIFVPVLVFSALFLKPRGWAGVLMLGIFLLIYVPWLVRNAMVCGDFRGMAGYAALDGIVRPEAGHMRRFAVDLGGTSGNYFAANFRVNLVAQVNRIVEYMGWSFVAPVALLSVLHAFRRPVTALFRWVLFSMWASAVCGMAIFGMKEEHGFAADQFYLLFVPLFICYGMAYILVQWDRRIGLGFILPQWSERSSVHRFLRSSLIAVIFLVSGIPLTGSLLFDKAGLLIEWPPYIPPYIAKLKTWFGPKEIIGSDMPWAVAWYADRRSLWLPYDPQDLFDLSDYQRLGGPVSALYFTPISGTGNTLADLVHGDYSQWTGYIFRTNKGSATPYPYKAALGPADCVLYLDRPQKLLPGISDAGGAKGPGPRAGQPGG